jgi:hypothetical protein
MPFSKPPGNRGDAPTVRQVYAVARELCERMGEEFPPSRSAASELIERLRTENGRPAGTLVPAREPRGPRRRDGPRTEAGPRPRDD